MPDNATDQTRRQRTPLHLGETRPRENGKDRAKKQQGSGAGPGKDIDPRDSEGIDKANA